MDSHEKLRELCAAAIAGELSVIEQARLNAHLALCSDCRRTLREFDVTAVQSVAVLAEEHDIPNEEVWDHSWSIKKAEAAFFKRLDKEPEDDNSNGFGNEVRNTAKTGKRYTYRPLPTRWSEIWMPFAAAVLLTLVLAIATYRTGVRRGTDVTRTGPQSTKTSENSLEERASDAGYESVQLEAKLAENGKIIEDLKHQLAEQVKVVNSLKSLEGVTARTAGDSQENPQSTSFAKSTRSEELSAAQTKLAELQNTVEATTAQRDENARQAATLEGKVNELTQLVREHEQALDQRNSEVAKGQELLEHDRDIRELMGARDLYVADIRDVSRTGTDKTYGRVFYTKGKSLIFYAFDLDAQPGVRNASSFQAWGRRGPDKQQALSIGIFYEDNVNKKRWVVKANDPKTLEDIDAVFVTVEPNGGSHHPSGKQLLFAYLRVDPNHP